MRILRVELRHVRMPLAACTFRTAFGALDSVDGVLVRLISDSGEAWAESTPFAAPSYSPEWAGGAFACLQAWMAPVVVGREFESGEDLQAALGRFKGNYFAKAALDFGWWLLEANRTNRPLHELLGGTRTDVEVGEAIGVMDTVAEVLAAVGMAIEQGYRRVKLKIEPGWDLDVVAAVRRSFPDLTLHVDCNSGYTLNDLPLFKRLDGLGLSMIEQPLGYGDLIDHAQLQKELETAICLDESIRSVDDARHAIALGSCRYVNVKPGRVGGLTSAIRIIEECAGAGVPCWVGGMLESALGAAICAELATLDNIRYPSDVAPGARFYDPDLSEPPLVFERGRSGGLFVKTNQLPGVPQRPRAQALDRWTLQAATVTEGTVDERERG